MRAFVEFEVLREGTGGEGLWVEGERERGLKFGGSEVWKR